MKRYLLCHGDATDLATWSNIPYFLLQAGRAAGVLDGGLPLDPAQLRSQRWAWCLGQALRSGRYRGFQYSQRFAHRLLAQAQLSPHEPLALLSHFPFLPAYPWPPAWQVDFYIDATTRQVFDDYGVGRSLDPGLQRRALERERQAYAHAGHVLCMCQWAADSVIRDYGIDPAKVRVLPGGANLDEAALAALPPAEPPPPPRPDQPLRLGFLGKEWERKGGPFLLELVAALERRGIAAIVRAIGPDPAALPTHPALQPLGFINKQSHTAAFVAELRSWHFGTLFSSAEAAPRSNLECLRLGVPVLAHRVGGIASTVPDEGCGQLFAAHPSPAAVAGWIAGRLEPYADYLRWRAALAARAQEFTWAAAAAQLQQWL